MLLYEETFKSNKRFVGFIRNFITTASPLGTEERDIMWHSRRFSVSVSNTFPSNVGSFFGRKCVDLEKKSWHMFRSSVGSIFFFPASPSVAHSCQICVFPPSWPCSGLLYPSSSGCLWGVVWAFWWCPGHKGTPMTPAQMNWAMGGFSWAGEMPRGTRGMELEMKTSSHVSCLITRT